LSRTQLTAYFPENEAQLTVPKKLIVVNDLHPSELAGAATIAHELAQHASLLIPTEYWFSLPKNVTEIPLDAIDARILRLDTEKLKRMQSKFLSKMWREFFNWKTLVWFFMNLRRTSPDVVWIHQIGNRFPRTIIILCRTLRIETYVTAHDFGLVLPRKLFPRDLGFGDNFSQMFLNPPIQFSRSFPTEPFKFKLLLLLRLKVLICLYNNFTNLICISSMQAEILRHYGFKVNSIIGNGINGCECKFVAAKEPRSILFAGRAYGKGLHSLIQGVKESNWHLFLAGSPELERIANEFLREDQFTYLGLLDREGVYEAIHRVSCVSVISECFDVFPSILIESLRHRTMAIATESVGNSNLLKSFDIHLVIQQNQIPNLQNLEVTLRNLYSGESVSDFDSISTTVEQTLNTYLSKFNLVN
jgi:glycosyltransferase involved in cell wall biosynthesis